MSRHGYGRWEDALLAREQHLRFLNGRFGRAYMRKMQDVLNAQHHAEERMPDDFLWYVLRVACEEGDPIYVSDDVTEVIDEARKTFEPEKLLATDLFTPAGFMLLPRPVLLNDHPQYGEEAFLPVRAMAWMTIIDPDDPERGCAWVSFLTSHEDDPEYSGHLPAYQEAQAEGAGRGIYELDRNALFTASHTLQMTFGAEPWKRGQPFPVDEVERGLTQEQVEAQHAERGRQQWVLPQVAWRLAMQLVRAPERPSRATRRELKRFGRPQTDVTVIRLRRYREPLETDGDFKGYLKHRFVVRGHWRNQWYPTLGEHRQKWIAPYVKGPEDGDLIVTERVFEFVR